VNVLVRLGKAQRMPKEGLGQRTRREGASRGKIRGPDLCWGRSDDKEIEIEANRDQAPFMKVFITAGMESNGMDLQSGGFWQS